MSDLYNAARIRMVTNQFDWVNIPARMLAFVDEYVFDEAHYDVGDMGLATPPAESLLLTNQHVGARGYVSSDGAWFQNVLLDQTWLFLVLVDATDETIPANRPLIAFIDQGLNLPRRTNGQDEIVMPDWLHQQGWFRP